MRVDCPSAIAFGSACAPGTLASHRTTRWCAHSMAWRGVTSGSRRKPDMRQLKQPLPHTPRPRGPIAAHPVSPWSAAPRRDTTTAHGVTSEVIALLDDDDLWFPAKLEQQLKEKGWTVRCIKEDGGCYEVYAMDDKGQRVEAYFHPVTLAPVPTRPR